MRSLRNITNGPVNKRNTDYLEAYFELMALNGSSYLIKAARSLKIFPAFSSGPLSAEDLVKKMDYNLDATRLLLDGLVELKLLEKKNDLYIPSPVLALLKGDYENLGSDYWEHLSALIKTGKPLVKMDSPENSEKEYEKQVKSLEWMMHSAALEAVKLLDIGGKRKKLNILDVGAGSGVWSIAMLLNDPESKITLLDWEKVLKVARQRVDKERIGHRVSFLEGDYFKIDIPDTYDLIIVGNVLHTQSRSNNIKLLKKLKESLSSSGEILIFDVIPQNKQWQLLRILYELGLRIRTEEGKVYHESEIREILEQAGYSMVTTKYLNSAPHIVGMCIARKK